MLDQRVAGSGLTGGPLYLSKTIYPLLVLDEPRKCPDATTILLNGM